MLWAPCFIWIITEAWASLEAVGKDPAGREGLILMVSWSWEGGEVGPKAQVKELPRGGEPCCPLNSKEGRQTDWGRTDAFGRWGRRGAICWLVSSWRTKAMPVEGEVEVGLGKGISDSGEGLRWPAVNRSSNPLPFLQMSKLRARLGPKLHSS